MTTLTRRALTRTKQTPEEKEAAKKLKEAAKHEMTKEELEAQQESWARAGRFRVSEEKSKEAESSE